MNNKPKEMNILIIVSTIYLGGAQKVARVLANTLAERHNVTMAYCVESGHHHLVNEKCGLRKLPDYAPDASIPVKIRGLKKQVDILKNIKKELNIDVSVSLGNTANLINALSKGEERVICSERSNPKKSWGRLGFLTRVSFNRADHVVFQSEKVRSFYGNHIRKKSVILKNPLPIPEPAHEQRKKKIVTMGRLTPQKNHAMLIRSFARFHECFPEYSLHIYGEGELEEQLKELAESLDIKEAVYLEGHSMNVHEQIRDAEMFVLASNYEGLSNALLECMSMGIACISTRCEGSIDVIRNKENGLLVDIGDEAALAAAMCQLAEDPDLRRRIEQQAMQDLKAYDKDAVVSEWEQLIMQSDRS